MNIPIENIYYLLCYAWDKLDAKDRIPVNKDDYETLIELFSKVLYEGTVHILKAGIDQSYVTQTELIPGIKGKLLFGDSLKQNTFQYGRTICSFDELSPNILHNQILKTTISRLLKTNGIDQNLHVELKTVYTNFHQVEEIDISQRSFSSLRLHRNNIYYSFVMNICELLYQSSTLDESTGQYEFIDFDRDEKRMAALFEAFVLNFYKREVKQYKVHAPHILWQAEPLAGSSLVYLPIMRTDIVLESKEKTFIIDTKFYKETMKKNYDKLKISRDNLFQIFSYIQNYEKPTQNLEGMLLYPTVQDEVVQEYKVFDKIISIKTINLDQPWREIEKRLKAILLPKQ